MIVLTHLDQAFAKASSLQKDCLESWIRISFQVGRIYSPRPALEMSIQNVGSLDVLLRSIEDEMQRALREGHRNFFINHQAMFSSIWVSSTYEIFRCLKSSKKLSRNEEFNELEYHLKLLRVTIDKHEIANDRHLRNKPLQIKVKLEDGKYFTIGEYDANDPNRTYFMAPKLSQRGSVTWDAIDGKTRKTLPLERLELSKRVVELFREDDLT